MIKEYDREHVPMILSSPEHMSLYAVIADLKMMKFDDVIRLDIDKDEYEAVLARDFRQC